MVESGKFASFLANLEIAQMRLFPYPIKTGFGRATDIQKGCGLVTSEERNMREVYARYFFSLFDADKNQDDVGRRQAQAHLEEFLTKQGACLWPAQEGAAEPA